MKERKNTYARSFTYGGSVKQMEQETAKKMKRIENSI